MNKRTIELNSAVLLLLIAASIFIIHFLFFRHSFPPVNIDEASFFSPAQSFANRGILASDIHKSFLPGSAEHTYWMPPLYIVLLGGFLKIFGDTVLAAKILSLVLSCGSALALSSLTKDKYGKAIAAGLFLICPFIIITSAFIRVEALAIFITVLAIVAVKKSWSPFWLGIIAGLALMTHPLMLACGAALALTAVRRGFKPFCLFCGAFLITVSPYIWYIFQDVALFKEQMGLQFLRKAKAKITDLKPAYLLQSVPLALLAIFCFYKIKREKELRLFLVTALLLSLAIVLKSNEFNYQVYLIPYVVAAAVLAIKAKRELPVYRYGLPLLLYGFFAVILVSKLAKYHFRTDSQYDEMTGYLAKNKSWNGRHIYVTGGPDISTYLLMNGQDVERQIPVPLAANSHWFDKYDYVVSVTDNENTENAASADTLVPWRTWKKVSFSTSQGAHSMFLFQKQ